MYNNYFQVDIVKLYIVQLCSWDLEYADFILCRGAGTPSKKSILVMTLECFWWWDTNSEHLGSVEHPFIAIISHVPFDLKWEYLLGSHLWVK